MSATNDATMRRVLATVLALARASSILLSHGRSASLAMTGPRIPSIASGNGTT
jgi:hypothetical protein